MSGSRRIHSGLLAGDAGGRAERQGGRRARGDHHALHAEPLGQPLRDRVVQVVQRHVALRRVLDRLHDLGLHQRRREDRVRASRVDERPDAELAEVVASGGRGACAGRRRGEEVRRRSEVRRASAESCVDLASGIPGGAIVRRNGRSRLRARPPAAGSRVDQSFEQFRELAGAPVVLGMPLHADAEAAAGPLDGFDDAVRRRGGHDESWRHGL